jgi:hypothetical protein
VVATVALRVPGKYNAMFAGEIGEIKAELNSSNQATIKDAVKKV